MPTPTKGPRLGGGPAHERLMLANLATSLFEHGRITTTEAKARRLRPLAERLITFAKKGDLHARRRVLTVVRDKEVVHTLFTEIGPQYAERSGEGGARPEGAETARGAAGGGGSGRAGAGPKAGPDTTRTPPIPLGTAGFVVSGSTSPTTGPTSPAGPGSQADGRWRTCSRRR